MASELKVDKFTGVSTAGSILVTGEGNSTTTNLQQGLNKVWYDLDGTGTIALDDSFNCSGTTDNGTGDYTISYSNAMASANYSTLFGGASQLDLGTTAIATGSNTIRCRQGFDSTTIDADPCHGAVAGDLAQWKALTQCYSGT